MRLHVQLQYKDHFMKSNCVFVCFDMLLFSFLFYSIWIHKWVWDISKIVDNSAVVRQLRSGYISLIDFCEPWWTMINRCSSSTLFPAASLSKYWLSRTLSSWKYWNRIKPYAFFSFLKNIIYNNMHALEFLHEGRFHR